MNSGVVQKFGRQHLASREFISLFVRFMIFSELVISQGCNPKFLKQPGT